MNYDEKILKDLVSIYEKRDANSSSFKTSVKIKITKSKYPKYFADTNGYNEAIYRLSQKEYIKIKYIPHDTVIESIILNIDKIHEIHSILNTKSIDEKRKKLLSELEKYDDKIIISLKDEINEKISSHKSIKQYLNEDFIDAIRAVHYIEHLDHDVYERNASNYIFNDSKRLTKIKSIISSIYDNENIFKEKGILSVPPQLTIKGNGIVHINDQTIDLSKIKNAIGLQIDNINVISFEQISKVTTIENLTTFFDYVDDGLIIYLGGFPTRNQISVLKKLRKICPHFYHFGDIDFGGYLILNTLMENINCDIVTVNMSLQTLKSNIKYSQPIDDKYIRKLELLLDKPLLKSHYNVIRFLIKNKVRLEQESFYNI
ncbi:MAG: hypothetical protein J1F32_03035 [Erysipelotrichales bacterium]|nr:hypothetical protein [Erysipelotrichales bacterium]